LQQGNAEALALLQAEWQDIQAKRAKLAAELARREAEAATAEEQITKLRTTLPLARQREANIRALAADGFAPTNQADDRTRERVELERDLATQQARAIETQAAVAEARRSLAAHLAETQRALSDRAAQARLKLAQLKQEGNKNDHRERLTHLTAPVAGTVQQLAVHTTGGVVTAAQTLMVIVPEGAEVTAEVVVDNKDIGFVQAGQHAEVKLETFNFTRYGTVPAQVLTVSADAVADEKRGAIFPATLKLARSQIDVDGRAVGLAPGMNVTAEIKTGRRRVIEFLWSPLRQALYDSGRER
jgi:hemolysin D